MSWEDQSKYISTALRIRPEIYRDEKDYAAIPYVFGTRKLTGRAIQFAYRHTTFKWTTAEREVEAPEIAGFRIVPGVTYESITDPIPVVNRLQDLVSAAARFRRSIMGVITGFPSDVPPSPHYQGPPPPPEVIAEPLSAHGDHYYPKVRDSALIRMLHRLYPFGLEANQRPTAGNFGNEENSTLVENASQMMDYYDVANSAFNDFYIAVEEIKNEALRNRPFDSENPVYFTDAPDLRLYIDVLSWRSRYEVLLRSMLGSARFAVSRSRDLLDVTQFPIPTSLAERRTSQDNVEAKISTIARTAETIDRRTQSLGTELATVRVIDNANAWLQQYTPGDGRTSVLKYYTGRIAFCYGVLDKFARLYFNRSPLPLSPELGDNRVVFPTFFGGPREDGGAGGLGSERLETRVIKPQTIRLFSGANDQVVSRFNRGAVSTVVDYYRGTALMAFDTYNLGSTSVPQMEALVQRIHKKRDGSDQWFDGFAGVCPTVEGETADYTVVLAVDTSGSMHTPADPVSRAAAAVAAVTQLFAEFRRQINAGANINVYIGSWAGNASERKRRFYPAETIADEAALAQHPGLHTYFFGGHGTSFSEGVVQLEWGINAARTAFPTDRPIYAYFITDGNGNLPSSSFTTLKTLTEYENVTLRAISIYNQPNEVVNRIDHEGAAYYIPQPMDNNTTRLADQLLGIFQSLLVELEFMNPVHALRELLTDNEIGFGIPDERIDALSFEKAAEVCSNEGLCFSYILDTETDVDQALDVMKKHINCEVYDHVPSNSIRIKIIRNDYDLNAIPALGPTDIGELGSFSRSYNDQDVGGVTVTYTDIENERQAVTILTPVYKPEGHEVVRLSFPGAPNAGTALKLALRELLSRRKATIHFTVTLADSDLYPGDPVKVTFQPRGLNAHVMRVRDRTIDESGFVQLSLVQDVFADTPASVMFQPFVGIPPAQFGWGYNWGNDWGN